MAKTSIAFTDEMVQAILDGRKTQTRRPVKPQPPPRTAEAVRADGYVRWRDADGIYMSYSPYPWGKPGRVLTIEGRLDVAIRLTDIIVGRLQEVFDLDGAAQAEGVADWEAFMRLWGSIYGDTEYRWDNAPWVWVLTFERVEEVEHVGDD